MSPHDALVAMRNFTAGFPLDVEGNFEHRDMVLKVMGIVAEWLQTSEHVPEVQEEADHFKRLMVECARAMLADMVRGEASLPNVTLLFQKSGGLHLNS